MPILRKNGNAPCRFWEKETGKATGTVIFPAKRNLLAVVVFSGCNAAKPQILSLFYAYIPGNVRRDDRRIYVKGRKTKRPESRTCRKSLKMQEIAGRKGKTCKNYVFYQAPCCLPEDIARAPDRPFGGEGKTSKKRKKRDKARFFADYRKEKSGILNFLRKKWKIDAKRWNFRLLKRDLRIILRGFGVPGTRKVIPQRP